MLVAERRHSAEFAELKNALEQSSTGASASALAARETAIREAEANLQAAWTLAFRTAVAQSTLASAITAKSQAALQRLSSAEISDVERSAWVLSSLTTNFRLLAHTMVSGADSNEVPVHLGSLIGSIAEQAGRISAERRVVVRTSQVDPSITILADESRLRYALMCLLINAIRFTPAGGAVDLVVGASSDGCVRVGVSDNGLGIAPAKLQELRTCLDSPAQATGAGGSDGMGLGIPVAHAFARKMSGALELDSRLGDGTQANLVFPASKRCHSAERASVG
jgi:signal transduction histidine kinase